MSIFAQRVVTATATDGEIPAGFLFASLKNRGSQPIQIDGVSIDPGEAVSYPFVGKAYETAVPYILQGQTLRIMYIQ